MKRVLSIGIDQLYRAHPGGIGTYVRGLLSGLHELGDAYDVVGVAPRERLSDEDQLPARIHHTNVPLSLLTRLWPLFPLGVAREAEIVHATSLAGPFAGGASDALHSVAVHDLLWRDEPDASTRRGRAFHEKRLGLLVRRRDIRVFTTSPDLGDRLVQLGIHAQRIHFVRLGVDDTGVAASTDDVAALLARYGVHGAFTFYAGTREPRKNLVRLVEAHRLARAKDQRLGPLVLAGTGGWGNVNTQDAVVLGRVERAELLGLYRDAAVVAYVALAEGWGLPPVEALHAGARVVASTTVPSVRDNECVVHVDPLDVASIATGLLEALESDTSTDALDRRRRSVSDLTWENSARDHLEGWR